MTKVRVTAKSANGMDVDFTVTIDTATKYETFFHTVEGMKRNFGWTDVGIEVIS